MKSGRWFLNSVDCPFYKGTEAQKIICEGVVDNSSIHLAFSTPSLRKDYQENICKKCDICPVKRMHERLELSYDN